MQANWPGATAEEVTLQVTERIEKKLEELESLDFTKSITTAGQTTVFVNLLPTTKARDVEPTWVRVRNMIADIKSQFPERRAGAVFQRPLRRRLRQYLRLHRRWRDACANCATRSRSRARRS